MKLTDDSIDPNMIVLVLMKPIHQEWQIQDPSNRPIQKKILSLRGIRDEEIESFFRPSLSALSNPFLFTDMEKAVARVQKAIDNNERIIVFGDYDVDGITGTAIIVKTLLKLNANVSYRIPHRIYDGYGLKTYFIDDIADKQVSLLITVDNGITALKEITYASSKNIDVIITDHHDILEQIPSAYAILHPRQNGEKYPFAYLSGSGVAYVFAKALLQKYLGGSAEQFTHTLLDLAALGTIADCVPLIGENRIIAWHGLQQIRTSTHVGLEYLMDIAGLTKNTVDTRSIEYVIAPRLNAGGRMSTALDALHLFLFPNRKAQAIAQKLHELNLARQQETENILREAEGELQKRPPENIILLKGTWHIGVIGIVAARLAEKYYLPTIILGEKDDTLVASCRSEGNTNILQLLHPHKRYFLHYGGHERAAGFDMNKKDFPFLERDMHMETRHNKSPVSPPLLIDGVVDPREVTLDLARFIASMAPFGEQNENPLLVLKKLRVLDKRFLKDGKHVKFSLASQQRSFEAISFNTPEHWKQLFPQQHIDIAFEVEENVFNGKSTVSLIVQDIHLHDIA